MLLGRSRSGPKTPGMEMLVVFAVEIHDTILHNVHTHHKAAKQAQLRKAKVTAPLDGVPFKAEEKEAKEKANPTAARARVCAKPRPPSTGSGRARTA